jgi:hypothetical protein
MDKVSNLMQGWEMESRQKEASKGEKSKKGKGGSNPQAFIDDGEIVEDVGVHETAHLFDDDTDSDNDQEPANKQNTMESKKSSSPALPKEDGEASETEKVESKDLFGESSDDESDEELVPAKRKDRNMEDDESATKKRKVDED